MVTAVLAWLCHFVGFAWVAYSILGIVDLRMLDQLRLFVDEWLLSEGFQFGLE